jgi:hypothetical protein
MLIDSVSTLKEIRNECEAAECSRSYIYKVEKEILQ